MRVILILLLFFACILSSCGMLTGMYIGASADQHSFVKVEQDKEILKELKKESIIRVTIKDNLRYRGSLISIVDNNNSNDSLFVSENLAENNDWSLLVKHSSDTSNVHNSQISLIEKYKKTNLPILCFAMGLLIDTMIIINAHNESIGSVGG